MYRTNSPRCNRLPRKIRFPARALLLAGVLAAVLFAPGTARAGTLDQQQENTAGGPTSIDFFFSRAQTFTASITGTLDQVDLFLVGGLLGDPLTVQIQGVSGGVPNGVVLASASVPAASVPDDTGSWIAIPIAPVAVTAGTQYAIVVSTSDFQTYAWFRAGGDVYAGGAALAGFIGDFWTPMTPSADLAFRTYVIAAPTAVSVRSASTARTTRGVLVRWRTGSEVGLLGFNVYRERAGKRVRLTRTLIPTRGGSFGAAYSWLDRRAPRKPARYWVRTVNADGSRTWLGPLRPG